MPTDAERRLHPRIFDTDWLMLRGMTRVLGQLVTRHVREGQKVLDFGCGNRPRDAKPSISAPTSATKRMFR